MAPKRPKLCMLAVGQRITSKHFTHLNISFNMENKSQTSMSDDGYGTDNPSPTISPSKENQLNVKQINREAREFRTKYYTEKVLNNSANGVIYQGCSRIVVFFFVTWRPKDIERVTCFRLRSNKCRVHVSEEWCG